MENTKRYHYSIFSGVTPFFNENDFSICLIELGVSKDSSWLTFIRWKGQKYNAILSNGIEEYMNMLRNDLHISTSKIEFNIYKNCNINIERQLDRLISINFTDSENSKRC